ncbi:DNA-binding protein YbaB [Hydrogenivirga caldilitoris]|uniref:DNA-binding protein YbaB n=1 Tax=Hydrogenivirga caldilitoris TaxID=246264 RepID=A0A497XQ67_9AQUI|nr:YbaB/EbfC family nucleoid-associated protein [Hydrogenivirga caldilitoris]RLJ70421.1 DNA-binding protein YbaB [Hydrogenivirga caldilitoris]
MNIYDMVKQLKNFQQGFEEVKEGLRLRKEVIDKEGVELIFNGLGEIVDIEIKNEELRNDWERLKPILIDLINQAQDISRDIAKEEFNRRFGGLLGGLGLGF